MPGAGFGCAQLTERTDLRAQIYRAHLTERTDSQSAQIHRSSRSSSSDRRPRRDPLHRHRRGHHRLDPELRHRRDHRHRHRRDRHRRQGRRRQGRHPRYIGLSSSLMLAMVYFLPMVCDSRCGAQPRRRRRPRQAPVTLIPRRDAEGRSRNASGQDFTGSAQPSESKPVSGRGAAATLDRNGIAWATSARLPGTPGRCRCARHRRGTRACRSWSPRSPAGTRRRP